MMIKTASTGVCELCGGPRVPSAKICRACSIWSREAIILAIEEWAYQHDGDAPKIKDCRGENMPSNQTIRNVFGSYNDALIAAGLTPHRRRRFTPSDR